LSFIMWICAETVLFHCASVNTLPLVIPLFTFGGQPNSRGEMRDLMVEFLKYVKLYGKFTEVSVWWAVSK